ncbi:hypothetical protein [Amorphus coralli]|uniref:hypothetical protein n=1 Tax=Amorphus coralli TaxID=340680 RepID=UPI0003738A40|nr:hypothetical protein [Amorphus coralli]
MTARSEKTGYYGAWLLCIAALAALIIAVFDTVNAGNGIAFTPGAYLVVATTALLLIGSIGLLISTSLPRWMTVILSILVLLDILGTGFAAWLLQAPALLAAVSAAGLGWLIYIVIDPSREHRPSQPVAKGA